MRDMPLVSIITVVYNGAGTIEQTIQSVLNQSYKNIEYIIVDGKSTDGTQEIIEKYKDSLAYFISEKDDGIYDAMNKGIRQAKGEIVGIINSDDWYEAYTVEKVVQAFAKDSKIGLVHGKINWIYLDGSVKEQICKPLETLWYQMSAVYHPTVFVKRKIYEEYGLFDLQYRLSSDYDFILRLYSNHVRFEFIDSILANFRIGGQSFTNSHTGTRETYQISNKYIAKCDHNKDQYMSFIQNRHKWIAFEDLIEKNPKVLGKMLNNYFNREIAEIIIFGVGMWGQVCYKATQALGLTVPFFLDNIVSGCNRVCEKTVEIKSPREEFEKSFPVLIAVQNGADQIEKQLEVMGVVEYVSIGKLRDHYFK